MKVEADEEEEVEDRTQVVTCPMAGERKGKINGSGGTHR